MFVATNSDESQLSIEHVFAETTLFLSIIDKELLDNFLSVYHTEATTFSPSGVNPHVPGDSIGWKGPVRSKRTRAAGFTNIFRMVISSLG